ncbi:MAG: hypothetical protein AB1635_13315 [Acidobacteriota bacterium]
MTSGLLIVIAWGLAGTLAAPAFGQSTEQLVAEAVTPLPDDLKAGATVVRYDPATGARQVLRQGTNFIECQPKDPADGFVRCYHKALGARRDLQAKLRAEKKSDAEIAAAVAAAVKAGTLPPSPPGVMAYRWYGQRDRIQNLWVFSVPNRRPEELGVSTVSQRDAALEGRGLPWMMEPGTPAAHIMIPINPKPAKSAITDEAADPVAQAVLPLPEDLRAGATVYTYDASGARKVRRQGSNHVECMPRGADGFTWCYSTVTGPRRDLQARLRAQGKTPEQIQAEVAAATKAGTIPATPFGTVSYRLYGKNDRIQLLWVISVPNATAESVAVSTVSQRDDALDHDGRPWLMLEGTPGAHIMVPINK